MSLSTDPRAVRARPLRAITRTPILERLDSRPDAALVIVTGSAGYGKTTLLVQYAERSGRSAYLRLTPNHNDASELMHDLAEALGSLEDVPSVSELRITDRSLEPGLLAASRLAEALAGLRSPALLVLDDLHVLQSHSAVDSLTVLIESVPPLLRIAAAGHDASALRLARLRATGRLLEVTEPELAFGVHETVELADMLDVDVSDEDTRAIVRETKGWPVAVSLALYSLAGTDKTARPRPASLVIGSVGDYIRTELLDPLDADQRSWLLRSSVLEVMTGRLCDTALETTGSEALLRAFSRSSLLITEADGEPGRYSYHPLLRTQLQQELEVASPGEIARIAARAAQWYHEHGASIAALDYARASGDQDLTARLLAIHVWPLHWSGRISTLEQWVGWFDSDGVRERYTAVAVMAGFLYSIDGRRHGAERWLAVAEHAIDRGPMPDGSAREAWVAMLRGMMAMSGPERVAADALAAQEGMRPDSPFMPGVRLIDTVASVMAGHRDQAVDRARETIELSESRGAWPGFAVSSGLEASLALRAGQERRARAVVEYALERLREAGLLEYVLSCLVHAVASRLAVLTGAKERARHHLAHVHRLRPLMTASLPWFALHVRLEAIEALIGLRDVAAARTLMREVDEILQRRPALGQLVTEADALRGRLAAIDGAGAAQWTLTAAELRVLQYLPTHLTFAEIAERLFVSPHTVKSQAVAIYGKLDVSSRRAAIETAVTYGLLDDSALRFPMGSGVASGIG